MKEFKPPRIFTFLFYVHWGIDLAIALISLAFLSLIISTSLLNREMAELGNLIFSLVTMLYGVSSFLIKFNNDLRESAALEVEASNVFQNCDNLIASHFPDLEESTLRAEEKVLSAYLDDWKKHKNIKPFEYQLLDSYLNHVVSQSTLDESDKLFLKYRVVSSTMTSHFPTLINEIENGDYFSNGTVHNKFIKKIYLLANKGNIVGADILVLDDEIIEDTKNYTLKKSNPLIETLLNEKKSREKIQYLLNKCYENAYTNIGNLDKQLSDDSKHNLVIMFKYDERFSIPKRQWHTEIKKQISLKYAKQSERDQEYKKEEENLKALMTPQPFSKAIQDFSYCIERLAPKEYFMYVVYPERFEIGARNWSVEKFMKEKVIPRAKEYLVEFNRKLIRSYPYLKKYQKKTVDANYYLFHFNRQHFEYYADQDSIPTAIKRFLVKSILESENASEHVASQLVYVKQVIQSITISGLLFTESLELQKIIQGKESDILKKARKNNLIINNVHEIASLGNQIEVFTRIMFESFYGKDLKRKQGKNYEYIKGISKKIIENAKEILQVFETIKTSSTT